MSGFVVIAVVAAIAAAIVGRWIVIAPAVVTWVLYVAGLKQHWWGSGVGDGWEAALLIGAGAAALGSLAGVVIGRGIRARWFRMPSPKADGPRG
ncbi:MAG: hypothetical protein ABIO78_08590 [Thermoanaerobaculia bacterium]